MTITLTIAGLDKFRKQIHQAPQIAQEEMGRAMATAVKLIEADAVPRAPHDTGNLRAAAYSRVTGSIGSDLQGEIGFHTFYAPYMEFGTGRFAEGPGAKGGTHWPPGAALETWAKRHGFESGGQVARIIGRRGGLKPRRFLRTAFKQQRPRVVRQFELALERIIKRLAE